MRKYLPLDRFKESPAKENFYYECLKCGDILPSAPHENIRCTCHNIMIDWDAGRLAILDYGQARLFEEIAE